MTFNPVEFRIEPALGPITAVVMPRGGTEAVVLTKPPLRAKLEALLDRSDRPFATESLEDGWVAGAERQATLDAYLHALDGPRLADDDEFGEAIADLPEDALASVFVRAEGLNVQGVSGAQVPSAFDWIGASLVARDDGVALDGTFHADAAPEGYEPTLLREVPAGAILALSFRGDQQAFRKAFTGAGPLPPGLDLEAILGVTLEDVLDLLAGQAVLYVRPGLPIPEVTFAVETDDEQRSLGTIDRIARKLGTDVEVANQDGVETHTIHVDRFDLSWSGSDGLLVVSTRPNARSDLRSDGSKLVDEDPFRRAAEQVDLGSETSGFVYVDLPAAAELIDGLAGIAGEELPSELARNLAPIESFVANADGSRFHGFLAVPGR